MLRPDFIFVSRVDLSHTMCTTDRFSAFYRTHLGLSRYLDTQQLCPQYATLTHLSSFVQTFSRVRFILYLRLTMTPLHYFYHASLSSPPNDVFSFATLTCYLTLYLRVHSHDTDVSTYFAMTRSLAYLYK